MPWMVQHKCNVSDPEPTPFAMTMMTTLAEGDITRVQCTNRHCREKFTILGHDVFKEAHGIEPGYNLPPGFVIARSDRGG